MTYTSLRSSTLLLVSALAACSDDATGDPSTSTTEASAPGSTGDSSTSTGDDTPTTAASDPPGTASSGDATSTSTSATSGTTESSSSGEPGTTTDATTGEPAGWHPPDCASVTGTGAVTFSHDEGATLAPMDQMIVPVHYTFGLVALGEPGRLLAGSGGEILASDDYGCSWHSIGEASGGNTPAVILHAAGATRAYGYGENDSVLVRVDDEMVTPLKSPSGPDGLVGLGVDPDDPDHVRIGDYLGKMWDSVDAGAQWSPIGTVAVETLAYRFAFDPHDLDHVVVGALGEGVLVSHDAGAMWQPATGLGPGDANGFHVVVSPVDGDIVWVEGLDLEEPDESMSRHIWRSEDGGLTFTAAVDADDATLYNGNHMFAHPTDGDVLYFVFGSNYQNYGTDVFRYEHAGGTITTTHNKWHDTVLAFLPGDPAWMFLGLSIEPGGG